MRNERKGYWIPYSIDEEALEKKYVQLAKSDPAYQQYLKIGDTFAFFMDLSKHFFLSTTLDEMHRRDKLIINEALKNPELLWDQHGFVCRYGEDSGNICHELQEAYYRSEARMRQLVEETSWLNPASCRTRSSSNSRSSGSRYRDGEVRICRTRSRA